MPITRKVNSKASIRKSTSNDLPFNPAQPVLNEYLAVSTASQTVINLSFSVDQSLTSQFFLFVDGKKLTLGSGNDYTFTSIDSTNFSSQITLTQSLSVNLNIQAYKLGLKKESEFGQDNRIVTINSTLALLAVAPTGQQFLSGSGTYNPNYVFITTSANATAGATYTNNSITFTVSKTISGATVLYATGSGSPLASGTLTKASGTGDATISFSTFSAPKWIRVRMVGQGGGGGSGAGSTGTGISGNIGSNTLFGAMNANGGQGGQANGPNNTVGGAGGAASLGGLGFGIAIAGGGGGGSPIYNAANTAIDIAGGTGGNSALGGGAPSPGNGGGNGPSGSANTGGGGAGGSVNVPLGMTAGPGGGSGGYCESIITAVTNYSYTVGTAGGGGGASTGGGSGVGGNGGTGGIWVEEYYK